MTLLASPISRPSSKSAQERWLATRTGTANDVVNLHTAAALRARAGLRKRQKIEDALELWWRATKRSMAAAGRELSTPGMDKETYVLLSKNIYKATVEEWDEAEATATANAEWEDDCRGMPTLCEQHFKDSIFELADVHTEHIDVDEYAEFLLELLEQVTDSAGCFANLDSIKRLPNASPHKASPHANRVGSPLRGGSSIDGSRADFGAALAALKNEPPRPVPWLPSGACHTPPKLHTPLLPLKPTPPPPRPAAPAPPRPKATLRKVVPPSRKSKRADSSADDDSDSSSPSSTIVPFRIGEEGDNAFAPLGPRLTQRLGATLNSNVSAQRLTRDAYVRCGAGRYGMSAAWAAAEWLGGLGGSGMGSSMGGGGVGGGAPSRPPTSDELAKRAKLFGPGLVAPGFAARHLQGQGQADDMHWGSSVPAASRASMDLLAWSRRAGAAQGSTAAGAEASGIALASGVAGARSALEGAKRAVAMHHAAMHATQAPPSAAAPAAAALCGTRSLSNSVRRPTTAPGAATTRSRVETTAAGPMKTLPGQSQRVLPSVTRPATAPQAAAPPAVVRQQRGSRVAQARRLVAQDTGRLLQPLAPPSSPMAL